MSLVSSTAALAARAANDTEQAWELICRANPKLAECANVPSFYNYRVDLAPNAVFLALFGVSLLGYVVTYAATRRGLGFTIALLLGIICEMLGYGGRIMSWQNQWDENGFLLQIITLTIGPAFMAAGIYLCLRRIVYVFGPENSRIPPEYYTRIFIPCDVISLVLQAAGGGMASVASHNGTSVDAGDNVMIAGLSFQVLTLLLFIACVLDFAVRTALASRRRKNSPSGSGGDEVARYEEVDPETAAARAAVRTSLLFRGFLAALALATVCILWRSVFRVAELAHGWNGYLTKRQDLFIGFEGVMVVVACLALNIFHPSVCFREMMEGAGGLGASKKNKKGKKSENGEGYVLEAETGGKSGSASDSEAALKR